MGRPSSTHSGQIMVLSVFHVVGHPDGYPNRLVLLEKLGHAC